MNTKMPSSNQNYLDNEYASARRSGNILSHVIIKGLMGPRMIDSLPLRIRCECSIPGCQEVIGLILSRRRKLRKEYPIGFIVVNSHAPCPPDVALYETEEYRVVEKLDYPDAVTDI